MKWHAHSPILIQGIAEPFGIHYAPRMKAYGTQIIGGVSSGYGGESVGDIPVFDLVEQAKAAVGDIEISLIFVPPYQVLDAALEAIAAGIRQLVIATAGVPPLDMIHLLKTAQEHQAFVLGSGSQGLLVPNQFWLGCYEPQFYLPGAIGILSRSDRLTDSVAGLLSAAQLGQSMVIGLGTDRMTGANLEQGLQILEEDDDTEAILLIGQPDGNDEIRAAEYIVSTIEKPVIAYFPGSHTPLESPRGDAISIIANQLSRSLPTISPQTPTLAAYKSAAIPVADHPSDLVAWMQSILPQPKPISPKPEPSLQALETDKPEPHKPEPHKLDPSSAKLLRPRPPQARPKEG